MPYILPIGISWVLHTHSIPSTTSLWCSACESVDVEIQDMCTGTCSCSGVCCAHLLYVLLCAVLHTSRGHTGACCSTCSGRMWVCVHVTHLTSHDTARAEVRNRSPRPHIRRYRPSWIHGIQSGKPEYMSPILRYESL